MALLKDMEKTKVIFHTHERVVKSDAIYQWPRITHTFATMYVLRYLIDDVLTVDIKYYEQSIESKKYFKGGIHHPAGPLASTHDMRWLINQYYND